MSLKLDNSLDLIYTINKNINNLKNPVQKAGAIKALAKYKTLKMPFLTKEDHSKLKKTITKIIKGGSGGKLKYDFFKEKKNFDNYGNFSPDLEKIISRVEKYKKNPDIEALLKLGGSSNPINTAYVEEMVGGGKKGKRAGRRHPSERGGKPKARSPKKKLKSAIPKSKTASSVSAAKSQKKKKITALPVVIPEMPPMPSPPVVTPLVASDIKMPPPPPPLVKKKKKKKKKKTKATGVKMGEGEGVKESATLPVVIPEMPPPPSTPVVIPLDASDIKMLPPPPPLVKKKKKKKTKATVVKTEEKEELDTPPVAKTKVVVEAPVAAVVAPAEVGEEKEELDTPPVAKTKVVVEAPVAAAVAPAEVGEEKEETGDPNVLVEEKEEKPTEEVPEEKTVDPTPVVQTGEDVVQKPKVKSVVMAMEKMNLPEYKDRFVTDIISISKKSINRYNEIIGDGGNPTYEQQYLRLCATVVPILGDYFVRLEGVLADANCLGDTKEHVIGEFNRLLDTLETLNKPSADEISKVLCGTRAIADKNPIVCGTISD